MKHLSAESVLVRRAQLLYIRNRERARRLIRGTPSGSYSYIAPHIYLGGQYRLNAKEKFRSWNISGVVNLRRSKRLQKLPKVEILHLPTSDWHPPTIKKIEQGINFIDRHINRGGSVYIHCRLGEGRGPTMAAAYLIKEGMSVAEALEHLRRMRPVARPNGWQKSRLDEWHSLLAKRGSGNRATKRKTPKK